MFDIFFRHQAKKITCEVVGHDTETHLDYIYGTLPREHVICKRCGATTKFERPSEDRTVELQIAGDIRDGDTGGCNRI